MSLADTREDDGAEARALQLAPCIAMRRAARELIIIYTRSIHNFLLLQNIIIIRIIIIIINIRMLHSIRYKSKHASSKKEFLSHHVSI